MNPNEPPPAIAAPQPADFPDADARLDALLGTYHPGRMENEIANRIRDFIITAGVADFEEIALEEHPADPLHVALGQLGATAESECAALIADSDIPTRSGASHPSSAADEGGVGCLDIHPSFRLSPESNAQGEPSWPTNNAQSGKPNANQ